MPPFAPLRCVTKLKHKDQGRGVKVGSSSSLSIKIHVSLYDLLSVLTAHVLSNILLSAALVAVQRKL